MLIKSITKDYGAFSSTVVYDRALSFQPPHCRLHSRAACPECFRRGKHAQPLQSSIQRTRTSLRDYIVVNEFELFCTFTYDPKKVDSFDISESKRVLSRWLNNSRRTSPDLAYIVVPELHKSGRVHFHALIKNYKGKLKDSGVVRKSGRLYNISGWSYGYSTAVIIKASKDDHAKVASYMSKYITKDMLLFADKKRYWCSRNLEKPVKYYNIQREIEDAPLFVESTHVDEYFKIIKSRLSGHLLRDTVTPQVKHKTQEEEYHERNKH